MKKSTRKVKAKETLAIVENGYYLLNDEPIDMQEDLENMFAGTEYFTPKDLDNLRHQNRGQLVYETVIELTEEDTVSAIHRLCKESEDVGALNFASAKNPGGGFLNGAVAQEESLALSSALYPSQTSVREFYDNHRAMRSCVYSDAMIFSPDVPFFRNVKGALVPYSLCSVITSPAVNTGVVKRNEPQKIDDVPELMQKRINKVLALFHEYDCKTLVLGAWGCGVFQNEPKMIAQLFKNSLENEFKGVFQQVVFAIYSRNPKFIQAFQEVFEIEIKER